MKILLIGPPGSGKGTQSKFIIDKYNLLYIPVGNILRNISLSGTELGKKIKILLNDGKLIDDLLITDIIYDYIDKNKKQYNNGFLIDGFPRNLKQANLIEDKNIKFNIIIQFHIKNSYLIERLLGRSIHMKSGRIYHDTFNPPIKNGLDDITGELLEKREDDNINTINNRLNSYYCELNELRKYFIEKFIINDINYNIINVNLDSILLKKSISIILDNWLYFNKKKNT